MANNSDDALGAVVQRAEDCLAAGEDGGGRVGEGSGFCRVGWMSKRREIKGGEVSFKG